MGGTTNNQGLNREPSVETIYESTVKRLRESSSSEEDFALNSSVELVENQVEFLISDRRRRAERTKTLEPEDQQPMSSLSNLMLNLILGRIVWYFLWHIW